MYIENSKKFQMDFFITRLRKKDIIKWKRLQRKPINRRNI